MVAKSENRSQEKIVQQMRQSLKSKFYHLNKKSHLKTRLVRSKELNWIDSVIRNQLLFSRSFEYVLRKFGVPIQTKWLLNRLAQYIASNYLKMSKSSKKIDISKLCPFLPEKFRLISAIVIASLNLGNKLTNYSLIIRLNTKLFRFFFA